MRVVNSHDVSRRLTRFVEDSFEAQAAALVLQELRGLSAYLAGWRVSVERIQAAVVLPVGGDYAQFQGMLGLAKQDWRDALVSAGLANQDWPQKLSAALGDEQRRHVPWGRTWLPGSRR